MSQGKNNILISILLLLFAGQAIASNVVPCPNETVMSSDIMQSPMMDHSNSMMGEADNSAGKDCCAEDQDCPMSGSLSMSLPSLLAGLESSSTFQSITLFVNTPITQVPNSPYRPPILS